jgi:hypothetical protein
MVAGRNSTGTCRKSPRKPNQGLQGAGVSLDATRAVLHLESPRKPGGARKGLFLPQVATRAVLRDHIYPVGSPSSSLFVQFYHPKQSYRQGASKTVHWLHWTFLVKVLCGAQIYSLLCSWGR